MPELTANVLQDIGNGWFIFVAWFDAILPALKFMSLIVSGLLIYGAIYAIIKSGYRYWLTDRMVDAAGIKDLPDRRARRGWARAVQLIQNKTDRAAWIEALKEADALMNEGLKIKGYHALNADDRVRCAVEAGELQSLEEMQSAHALYNQTARTADFMLTHEATVQALRKYKKVIKELAFTI